jgi:glycosyltransferase involved in cell wall biosynthesis
MPNVALCTPTRAKPSAPYFESLAASLPVLKAQGWNVVSGTPEFGPLTLEIGSPYISHARSTALHKALGAGADAVIFIDDDLSWQPDALWRLLDVGDPVVAGTYRFKREPEEYMGSQFTRNDGLPVSMAGFIEMHSIPAGFLKITREGVAKFIKAFPELCYGDACAPHVDLFNHGAHEGVWWGEDFAFARRWREKCGKVWLIPDLQIDHHTADAVYPGNYNDYLRRQPGGDLAKDG